MESGKNDDLKHRFEGFEHQPKDDLWNRISREAGGHIPTGKLAEGFSTFTYTPKTRVWRRVLADLYPMRRRRTLAWISAAATITLLLTFQITLDILDTSPVISTGAKRSGEIRTLEPLSNETWARPRPAHPLRARSGASVLAARLGTGPAHRSGPAPASPAFGGNRQHASPLAQAPLHPRAAAFPEWAARPFLRTLEAPVFTPDTAQAALPETLPHYPDAPELPVRPRNTFDTRLASNIGPGRGGIGPNQLAHDGFTSVGNGAGPWSDLTESQSYQPKYDENFQTPFAMGLFLHRNLGRRWSLGGGMVYTRLSSTASAVNAFATDNYRITRQYLGLALTGQFNFLRYKGFATYATTGLQYDFGLGQHTAATRTMTYTAESTTAEDRAKLGPQMSANLGIGLRQMLTRRLGLYVQGMAGTYLMQSHYNLWSERTLWPTLQAGLRVEL